jgi:hypothetical protein
MSLVEIINLLHRVGRVQVAIKGLGSTEITEADAVEILETLARILDYTLVDREERRELLELAEEINHPERQGYASVGEAVGSQERAADALATAVSQVLRTENPQEV